MDRISTELVRALPIGIIVYKVCNDKFEDTLIEKTNNAAHETLGPVMGYLLGKTLKEVVLPPHIIEALRTAYYTEIPVTLEATQLKELDVPGWFHIKFTRMPDSDYVIETIEDTTRTSQARVFAEMTIAGKKLLQNHLDQRGICNHVLERALAITKSEHGFVSVVDQDTRVNIGYTLTAIMKDSCPIENARIEFPPDSFGRYPGLWGHALNTKEPFFTNTPSLHSASKGVPENHVPLKNFLAVPVIIGTETLGLIALSNKESGYAEDDLQNITRLGEMYGLALHRKQTDEKMLTLEKARRSAVETRYQAFVKATPDMLHLVSPEGKFLSTHIGSIPTAIDPADYLNKYISDVFDAEFTEKAMGFIQKTLETGDIYEWNYSLPQLPGQFFNCRFSLSGENEVLVVVRDLTNMIRTQSQLEDLIKDRTSQLEHSNQALQSFVYAASHDLREPLIKIVAFGTRLQETQKNLDEKGNEYITVMVKAAERLTQLIDDLLSFSRLGEKDDTDPIRVSTRQILQEVVSDLAVSIDAASAKVIIDENIPDIFAHPMRARQVFQNLISNGLKFRNPNQPPIIHIKGRRVGEYTVIDVSDNGIGFEPEFKDKIFQVFTRLHSRFEYPGTGLGLALCRRILSLYGGSITAEGELGKGATFTVEFPSPLEL